jgi:hypothetical protein
MGCKVGWDLDFVVSNMDPSFDDCYRLHRATIVLSLEKSLIPSTQSKAVKEARFREKSVFTTESNRNIRELRKWVKEAELKKQKYLDKSSRCKVIDKDIPNAEKYMAKYTEISTKIKECKLTIVKIIDSLQHETDLYHQEIKTFKNSKEEAKYICSCPQDDCKGFIDSVTYKCGMCEKAVCKRCQTPDHEDHKCNPDTVETVKMLSKETKPCPKCRAPIFKIDGCDQIWCTSCHTAFSWRTGEVESGKIHNPHYYQWMRENGGLAREQGDVKVEMCGQQVNFNKIIRNVYMFFPVIDGINTMDYVTQCHRLIFHIRQVMIIPTAGYEAGVNLSNRIKYMLGDFDEKKWLSKIKAQEKIKDMKKCETSLFTMCANTLEDLLNNISMCTEGSEFLIYFRQLQALNKYITDNVLKLKKRFKVKMCCFDNLWNLIYV